MMAVTIGACFGWLHHSVQASINDTAVLLCAGLSRDASTGHRSFRILGDHLATAGYPTLRFDYPGMGDSCEVKEPECWGVWRDSIQMAADWLRAKTGARRIVLIGLRLGATLAALAAAERDDVAGLALLQPVLRGKSYVGQLLVESRLRPDGAAALDGGVAVNELHLSGETLGLMSQVDLRQVRLPAECAVAVFRQLPSPVLSACIEAWQHRGVHVAQSGFAGLEAFLRPSHLADEPPADVTPILSWLKTAVAVQPVVRPPIVHEMAVLRPDGCTETPLRFGSHGHLFGMLCRPDGDIPCDHVVIIGNTGGDPHHGFARFSVEFARRLAAVGFASLRIDFAGLGDSSHPPDDGEGPTHVFEIDRSSDIRAAIDMLEVMGYRHFTANGLCSGAYHALQGALADERIASLLLINLPWFTLRHEKAGPASAARRSMTTLSHRQVSTLLLFAEGDAGVQGLERHFGPGAIELADLPGAVVSIVPGLDHDLTGRAMRRLAADRMIDFLRYGTAVGTTPQPPALAAARALAEARLRTAQDVSTDLAHSLAS